MCDAAAAAGATEATAMPSWRLYRTVTCSTDGQIYLRVGREHCLRTETALGLVDTLETSADEWSQFVAFSIEYGADTSECSALQRILSTPSARF